MNEDLKPCPFCGMAAVMRMECDYEVEGHNSWYHAECNYCGAKMPPSGDVDDAVKAWNRRAHNESVC